jgi:hypothetical protein
MSGPGAGGAATSSAVLGDLIAVARGLSSTWAGLPPAPPGAVAAIDPTTESRRWFAFVPDSPPELRATELRRHVVPFDGGAAILTAPTSLDGARSSIRPIVPAGADVTLYPVDD